MLGVYDATQEREEDPGKPRKCNIDSSNKKHGRGNLMVDQIFSDSHIYICDDDCRSQSIPSTRKERPGKVRRSKQGQ